MRRLDIGVASYRNPEKLQKTLESIAMKSTTDFRCIIVHNPSEGEDDEKARKIAHGRIVADGRFSLVVMDRNVGYAGAVNEIFRRAATEYVAYCDNDIEITTTGWDEKLCQLLDMYHEIGVVFPNGGPYPIDRGQYTEVMWGVGYCFIMNILAACDVGFNGPMDTTIGHQEEADLCLRVRMEGWKCATIPSVHVAHHASATNDPAATERINRGVVNFVNKWCRYFGGKNLNYHSMNVLRWEDWPPNALYLEEYWKTRISYLNQSPESLTVDGRCYDLIRVPRYAGFYTGRII